MTRFLIFNSGDSQKNLSDFNALNDTVNAHFGYPNQATKTYSDRILHPDGVQVAIPVMDFIKDLLTNSQIDSLVDKLPDDWQVS